MEFFTKDRTKLESHATSPNDGYQRSPNPQHLQGEADQDTAPTGIPVQGGNAGIELLHTGGSTPLDNKESRTDTGFSGATNSPQEGELTTLRTRTENFGEDIDGASGFKRMVWWQAGMVMVAETISLGILALPQALSTLGLIPGILLLLILGAMASYTGYVIGQFKLAFPQVHSMADAGEVLFGKWGFYLLGAAQNLFFVFVMGSHILTFSIMMNVITDHSTCTIVLMVIGTVLSLIFTLPRTLRHLSFYSVSSFISIVGAVLITMIGISITRPAFKTVSGHQVHEIRLWPDPTTEFHAAFLATLNIVFAYAGHVAFFTFISEMKDPKDFPKALAFLQVSDISMYMITAIVIYYYAGSSVASPALDSAGPLVRKIAYGVAIPTIVIAGVVNAHVALKFQYSFSLRDKDRHFTYMKTLVPRKWWITHNILIWTLAWLIAECIPRFNDLLGITSALFASWFTFGLSGVFWCHINLKIDKDAECALNMIRARSVWNWKKSILLIVNLINILVGLVICVVGLYAGAKSISINTVSRKPFSCANNSGY